MTFSNVGSVDTEVTLHDGNTATVLYVVPVPSGAGAGKVRGVVLNFPDPLVLTANNALYVTCLTAATVKPSFCGFEA